MMGRSIRFLVSAVLLAAIAYLCWVGVFHPGPPDPGPHPTHVDPRF